ncbi:MAG TPA: dihydrofolate reductase family protein [Anaerolineaceae bacterium]|nr:dihydrofolate reductase family protein [Anaerolineaceae bacterium]
MGKVIFHTSVSLDGYVAGPNDEVDQVFAWYTSGDMDFRYPGDGMQFKVSRQSAAYLLKGSQTIGAVVTGRRTFDLAQAWAGAPPLGAHHFVVTHHIPAEWDRPGSPFTFVTDGVESAIRQAKAYAGDRDVALSTASVLQQALKAGLVDRIQLDLAAVLLGKGVRLFDPEQTPPLSLEILEVVQGFGVTHLSYQVNR